MTYSNFNIRFETKSNKDKPVSKRSLGVNI